MRASAAAYRRVTLDHAQDRKCGATDRDHHQQRCCDQAERELPEPVEDRRRNEDGERASDGRARGNEEVKQGQALRLRPQPHELTVQCRRHQQEADRVTDDQVADAEPVLNEQRPGHKT